MLFTTGAADDESFAGDCGGLDGFELAEKNVKKISFHTAKIGHKIWDAAHLPSPAIFLIVYDPLCESVANLSTIASNSAKI